MIAYLTNNLVALISALGGWVFTVAAGAAFVVWVISNRIARESSLSTTIKHEEAVVAEANRHSEKVALIKANDPKVIEGMNKQLTCD